MKLKTALTTILAAGALGAAIAKWPEPQTEPTQEPPQVQILVDSNEEKDDIRFEDISVPTYSPAELGPRMCSRYARMAARDIFGMTYATTDAWDRIYTDAVIATPDSFDSLESLIDEDIVNQGMIVGVHNPTSIWNGKEDSRGHPITFSHNILYLGTNDDDDDVFAHQYGSKIFAETPDELEARGLEPRIVVAPKKEYQ